MEMFALAAVLGSDRCIVVALRKKLLEIFDGGIRQNLYKLIRAIIFSVPASYSE